MNIFETPKPEHIHSSRVIYYLAATLRNADGNYRRHYFIDSSKADLKKLANKLKKETSEFWLDWAFRDVQNGHADRRQISTRPFVHFSDPKNLTYTGI